MKKRWMSLISLGLILAMTSQTVMAAGGSSDAELLSGSSKVESSVQPGTEPTERIDEEATVQPSTEPTVQPSAEPTVQPSAEPTEQPEQEPTVQPSAEPIEQPEEEPTEEPDDVQDVQLAEVEKASGKIERLVLSQENGLGSTITLTPELKKGASAVEDGKSKYRYIYHYNNGDNNWYEITEESTKLEKVEWKPEKKGNYLIALQVIDADNEVVNFFCGLDVTAPTINLKSINTSEKTGNVYGISISPQYTTNVSDDDISFTYQIYDLEKQKWYTLKENVKDTQVDWNPLNPGGYWIYVTAKTSKGAESSLCIGYYVQGAQVTGLSMEEEQTQFYKNAVTLKGSVSNPVNQKLKYEYLAYDGAYWERISLSDELTACEFTAKKPGSYLLCFQAYDDNNKVIGQSFLGYNAEKAYAEVGNIKTTVVDELQMALDLDGKTNDPDTEYCWQYYDLTKKQWGNIQEWSKEKTATWDIPAFGVYWIHAEARTSDGTVTAATIGYEAKPFYVELKNMQVYTPDYATYYIQQGVETNDPKLKYEYMIYDLRTEKWLSLPSGGANTYWQPKTTGTYWIHVVITGSKGTTYSNTIACGIQGYKIADFGFSSTLEVGKTAKLSLTGYDFLKEDYTFKYLQWNGSGWNELYKGKSAKTIEWTPPTNGYFAFCAQVINQNGDIVDQRTINIDPSNFTKNGWYYEDGYKFYYINGVKQLDLDDIIGFQSSYVIKVNRTTCTVTVYASDGANGYIIPVKRFACSVGLPATPTPLGSYNTSEKLRWGMLMGPSWGQYCTRIVAGILFHSVAGSNPSSYNLNPANYNMLGRPASHGCVRLCVKDAKWIYDHCKLGTLVTIYDSPYAGPLGQGPVYRITNPNQNWDPTDPNV